MALLAKLGEVVASVVLETGLERAIEEFKQIFSVPDEIRTLTTTVSLTKAVLRDAEEKQISNDAVRDWLRELKQVFLDAEDLVDEYTTREALQLLMAFEAGNEVRSSISGFFVSTKRTVTTRPKISKINKRMDSLARRRDMFGLQLVSPAGNGHLGFTRRHQTSSLPEAEASVIGRGREKGEIIELLLSSDHAADSGNNGSFSVLPIVGMGGLGKTTLARLVYNDERVRQHFDVRMWVCVPNDFAATRLTKDMIESAFTSRRESGPCQVTHWDSMQLILRREVERKTFLLVLDDMWGTCSRSQWNDLVGPLNFANKGSKILVTTRNSNVIDMCQGRMRPFILQGLSEDDLWLLFKRCAFDGSGEGRHAHLEELGREIARRLKGLPLAAKTIGYLLNAKLDVKHWRTIGKSKMWELQQDEDDILPVLGLSYQYLPANLKQCFAYCSLFPKDHEFDKAEMVKLWDAECFGGIRRFVGMGDVNAEYFDNLLHRSFFEPAPSMNEGLYTMHDLIHDLAEYVSKDDCLRLEGQRNVSAPDTVRHMSLLVTIFDEPMLKELCRNEKLRTLLFLRGCRLENPTHALETLFSKLKRLRVLGLRGCGITDLPSSIGDLKHLRYIDASDNILLESLPESLGDLYNLQVLKLQDCNRLRRLPTGMGKLINLRHFQADYELASLIDELGRLTRLEEVWVRGRKVRDLGGMGMLRKLTMYFLEEVGAQDAIQAGLDSKEHLQVVMMWWGDYYNGIRDVTSINREVEEEVLQALRPVESIRELGIWGYRGAKSPGWMADPTAWASFCLQSVSLYGCPNWKELPCFGQLRLLRYLNIQSMHSIKCLQFGFLPTLERLHIEDLPQWEEWRNMPPLPPQQNPSLSSSTSTNLCLFPSLRELEVCRCPELRALPPLPPALRELLLQAVGLTWLPEILERRHGGGAKGEEASSFSFKKLTIECCPELNLLQTSSSFSSSLASTSSLEEFVILDSKPQQMKRWLLRSNLGFPILQKLYIGYCPLLTSFDEEGGGEESGAPLIDLPPSLRSLSIHRCNNLRCLPANLSTLSSLETLVISSCGEMQSLPVLGLPSSLREFYIRDCPPLRERCRDQAGPEWPMISRIPDVSIDGESII